jgi:uncharacterized protein HemX
MRGRARAESTFMTGEGRAMNEADKDNKARNRQIAENEAERQTVGDIRVSAWAIAVAVIIGLAAVGWVLIHNN